MKSIVMGLALILSASSFAKDVELKITNFDENRCEAVRTETAGVLLNDPCLDSATGTMVKRFPRSTFVRNEVAALQDFVRTAILNSVRIKKSPESIKYYMLPVSNLKIDLHFSTNNFRIAGDTEAQYVLSLYSYLPPMTTGMVIYTYSSLRKNSYNEITTKEHELMLQVAFKNAIEQVKEKILKSIAKNDK